MEYIHQHEVPGSSKVIYASVVCDHKPLKIDLYQVRLVVRRDRLSYDDDTCATAAYILEKKNSVISGSKKEHSS